VMGRLRFKRCAQLIEARRSAGALSCPVPRLPPELLRSRPVRPSSRAPAGSCSGRTRVPTTLAVERRFRLPIGCMAYSPGI